jgi:hypothetical protein
VHSNPVLDHQHKLDFVLTQFPDSQRVFALGVQITLRLNDPAKLQQFDQANCDERRVAERAIYIELSGGIDLDTGGSLAVFNVLSSFTFDRQYMGIKVMGALINNDLTYSFFDPKERATELILAVEKAARGPAVKVTSQLAKTIQGAMTGQLNVLSGYIHAFTRAQKIGYITGHDGQTYFLHSKAVVDDRLQGQLNQLPFSIKPISTHIRVRFANMGKQRADGYDVAGKVELEDRD